MKKEKKILNLKFLKKKPIFKKFLKNIGNFNNQNFENLSLRKNLNFKFREKTEHKKFMFLELWFLSIRI